VSIDGDPAWSVGGELNNLGGYVSLGSAQLDRGVHEVDVRIDGPGLSPGSAGTQGAVGPLTLSSTDAADTTLEHVPAARARRLCGRPWDWIEVAS
jgi:hypothetical protein